MENNEPGLKTVHLLVLFALCPTTDWDEQNRFSGMDPAPKLTPLGEGLAIGLGERCVELLRGSQPSRLVGIYSSDLPRALKTAELLHKGIIRHAPAYEKVPNQYNRRLWEVDLGVLTGLTKEEVHERYPLDAHPQLVFQEKGFDLREVGGDTEQDIIRRHVDLLVDIAHNLRDKPGADTRDLSVIIVGHGIALRSLLSSYGIPFDLLARQGTVLPLELTVTFERMGNFWHTHTHKLRTLS